MDQHALSAACPWVCKIAARSVSDAGFECPAWMTSRWRFSFCVTSRCAACGSGSACATVRYSWYNQSRCSRHVVFKHCTRPRLTFVVCVAHRRFRADRRRHYQNPNRESTRPLQIYEAGGEVNEEGPRIDTSRPNRERTEGGMR